MTIEAASGASRRAVLAGMAAAAGAVASPAVSRSKYSRRAMALVERSLVIDMLAPLSLNLTPEAFGRSLSEREVEEFRTCGVTGMHHAIGIGGPRAYEQTLQFIAGSNGFMARNDQVFHLVDKAADLEAAKARGKIAVILGMQNADHFRTPDDVKAFRHLGQRVAQLTYNSQNLLGSGSTERVDGGLSDYGVKIVETMNEARMLVDVSHSGDRTTLDAVEVCKGPMAFTHSNCRALNNHPRLKTDEAIKALARKGGVMGITAIRNFVRDREPTTIEHYVDHIDHVVKLVGVEHVGIGSDYDLNGSDDMDPAQLKAMKSLFKPSYAFRDKLDTDGFDHPRRVYDLTDALIRRGYSDPNITAILGGNFRRLLAEVWGG